MNTKEKLLKLCGSGAKSFLETQRLNEDPVQLRGIGFDRGADLKQYLDFDIYFLGNASFKGSYITQEVINHFSNPEDFSYIFYDCQLQDEPFKRGISANIISFQDMIINDLSIFNDTEIDVGEVGFYGCNVHSLKTTGTFLSLKVINCEKFPSMDTIPEYVSAFKLIADNESMIPANMLSVFTRDHTFHTFNLGKKHRCLEIIESNYNDEKSIYDCASELIDAGFDKYAVL